MHCTVLSINNQSLGREETLALVRAMEVETRVESVELFGDLDSGFLHYTGKVQGGELF